MNEKPKNPNWGGKRDGAGRKATLPSDARPRPIRLTDEEYEAVKTFIKEHREQKLEDKIYTIDDI